MTNQLQMRKKLLANTDQQRRYYNGCNAKEELQWSDWQTLEINVAKNKIEERLSFWRDLNKYSVSIGGKLSEFRIVQI